MASIGGCGRQLALSISVFSITQREDTQRVLAGSVQGAIPVEHQIEGLWHQILYRVGFKPFQDLSSKPKWLLAQSCLRWSTVSNALDMCNRRSATDTCYHQLHKGYCSLLVKIVLRLIRTFWLVLCWSGFCHTDHFHGNGHKLCIFFVFESRQIQTLQPKQRKENV